MLADIKAAASRAKQSITERDALIRAAMARTDIPRADLAAAAGVTEARLYQIRDGRGTTTKIRHNLTRQARETIRYREGGQVTIAEYIRHHYPDGRWRGDRCGCTDDRCIGFHHGTEDDCRCLEALLDRYVQERGTG